MFPACSSSTVVVLQASAAAADSDDDGAAAGAWTAAGMAAAADMAAAEALLTERIELGATGNTSTAAPLARMQDARRERGQVRGSSAKQGQAGPRSVRGRGQLGPNGLAM